MQTKLLIGLLFGAILVVGSITTIIQIYKITVLDATARGIKHPKLWGFWAMGGNNSSGLLIYLINRRKYPIIEISEKDSNDIERYKKISAVGLTFLVIGALGVMYSIAMY